MARRSTLSAAAVGATALLLAGCSGGSGDKAPTASATTGPGRVTAAPQTSQPAGAIRDLTDVTCTHAAGAWSFSATLTNHSKATIAYTVTVSVAKTDGGTVVGSKQLTTTLAAGKSEQLSAKNFFKGTAKGVSCVPSATKKPG